MKYLKVNNIVCDMQVSKNKVMFHAYIPLTYPLIFYMHVLNKADTMKSQMAVYLTKSLVKELDLISHFAFGSPQSSQP